jgi:WD40 repeat protein
MRVLTDHRGYVAALAYAPDGRTLAVSRGTSLVTLWDTATWEVRVRLRCPAEYLAPSLAFAPDGGVLVTGGGKEGLAWWDVGTGLLQERTALPGAAFVNALAFSADGSTLAVANDPEGLHGDGDAWVSLLTLPPGQPPELRRWETDVVAEGLLFSLDGEVVVAVGNHPALLITRPRGLVIAWDCASGRELWRASSAGRISRPALLPDGLTLVFGEKFFLGKEEETPADYLRLERPAGAGRLRLLEVASGAERPFLPLEKPAGPVAVVPGRGQLVWIEEERLVRVRDLAAGVEVAAYDWGANDLMALAVAPDGMTAAVGCLDGRVIVWDLEGP